MLKLRMLFFISTNRVNFKTKLIGFIFFLHFKFLDFSWFLYLRITRMLDWLCKTLQCCTMGYSCSSELFYNDLLMIRISVFFQKFWHHFTWRHLLCYLSNSKQNCALRWDFILMWCGVDSLNIVCVVFQFSISSIWFFWIFLFRLFH